VKTGRGFTVEDWTDADEGMYVAALSVELGLRGHISWRTHYISHQPMFIRIDEVTLILP